MKLYVLFTLACAMHAHAASVPKLDVSDLQKKLAAVAQEAAQKEILPVDNTSSEQELTEQEISVNEVQNNIKNIPVKVVVDPKPVENEKLDDVDLDDGADIKRVEIDLKNPGAPQRQEHETQNPEHFEEPANSLKATVADAQAHVKQGLQDVSQGLQDWISNNEQINSIQQSIQSLQDNFKEQLNKLNQTVQSFLPAQTDSLAAPQQKAYQSIDLTIKTLEETFQKTINKMTDGVKAYALFATPSLRQVADSGSTTPGSPASGGSSTSNNIFLQYLQSLQNTITQGFANVTSTIQNTINANGGNGTNSTFPGAGSFINGFGSGIQNIFNPNGQSTTAAGAQSDEGSTTARPGWPIWQNIQSQLQNILTQNGGQNQAGANSTQSSSTGPIAQAIQNNPIVQAVGNFIQPNRPGAQQPATQAPAKPESDAQPADAQSAESTQEGSNAVPASDPKPTEEKKPEDGPIKKIIQNNPIMKGISGAVQKIQNIGNPEKPRDTLEGEDPEKEKGLLLIDKYQGGGHGGHGGHNTNPNTGDSDSNSSGEVAKSEPVKVEEIKAEESKETAEESIQKQPQPAKTE